MYTNTNTNKYKVLINGKNFKFRELDGIINSGFYTNVFVESEDEITAESIASTLLQEDDELSTIVMNEQSDLPLLSVLEIERIDKWPDGVSLPRTRLEVYTEH